MRHALVLGIVVAFVVGSGCTIRFSQSLTSALPQSTGRAVKSSDSGLAILGITVDEPRSAHEQVRGLIGACKKLTKVQVDYRELNFLLFGLPKVTVEGVCES